MTARSVPSITDHLSLEEVVDHLRKSPLVDGIAEFGSRTSSRASVSSDYDLLVLVLEMPVRVFQMVTSIHSRVADVLFFETETADNLLFDAELPHSKSFEAMFVRKMQTARIRYDASQRLEKVRRLVASQSWKTRASQNQDDTDSYAVWFWLSHSLLHLERVVQSEDPTYLAAADMMLTSGLSTAWRGYFDVRRLLWEGDKAAIRYWSANDDKYLEAVQRCLEAIGLTEKLIAYRELVKLTLEPAGEPFKKGETAVILTAQNQREDVQTALKHWQTLLSA